MASFRRNRKVQTSLQYIKAVNEIAPAYIQNLFTNVENGVNYSLRSVSNNNLFLPRANKKSLSYTGVIIWNSLPETLKKATSFTAFKNLYMNITLTKLKDEQ